MTTTQGLLLDVEFVMRKGQSAIRVIIKTEEGTKRFYDMDFEPYFYVDCTEEQATKLKDFTIDYQGKKIGIKRIEHNTLVYGFKEKKLHKIVVFHPGQVPAFKTVLEKSFDCYEYNIVWTKRFIIDKQLIPSKLVQVESEGLELKKITHIPGDFKGKIKTASIDIETYNPKGLPVPEKDPSLMISYYDTQKRLFTYEKEFSLQNVDSFENEKKMIEEFDSFVKFDNPDILCTYNGDQFDLPYLQTRAKVLGTKITLGRDHIPMRTRQAGMRVITTLSGRIHFDVYPVVAFMNFIGAIKLQKLTLENTYKEVIGVQKKMVERLEIWKTWDQGTKEELDLLATYCMGDSEACQALAEYFLPQVLALSAVTGMTFLEVSRGTASQFVEMRLMREAKKRNELFPNNPGLDETKSRMGNPIQGAYVKVPKPGVYENIAVLDFKSLYPSIIISYNIDPFTINCDCCTKEESYISPTGDRFCKKKKGIIPETLEKILNERIRVQGEMKKLDKESREYKLLWAEQWSLKILMNSFYGYLVYAKARYYSRDAGESVTALARKYIQETMQKAEEAGFEVLYGDTDSSMLLYTGHTEEDVEKFRADVNKTLPGRMQLELEDFYPRGIFVSKKQGDSKEESTGAKKKYALIDKKGVIKIRGFELVRRDWSKIARDTQKSVLEILLREGDVDKACNLVREKIAELTSGKLPLSEVSILAQLRKKADKYDIISPEVSAFNKAKESGLDYSEKTVFAYVVTKAGKSISDKAMVVESAKDYDPDYYLNHQLLPAVMKILGELGVKEEDLITNSKQKGLGDW
ncbi:DNA polymerase [uncultured archaeon]|nr:DNA polymerase [uncultured archaeon]